MNTRQRVAGHQSATEEAVQQTAQEYRVPFIDLPAQHSPLKEELLEAISGVLAHGNFINGPEVREFEERVAAYCGTRYAAGVNSGTDALILALKALGIGKGDEVITAPNSFLASASAIAIAGAKPVFVDVTGDFNLDPSLLEPAINERTRAIVPVHLTGRPANMKDITAVAEKHGLAVVEDAAQAMGATYEGRRAGSLGAVGCFSFHPVKSLGACGDGGIITTDDPEVYGYIQKARNHGLRNRDQSEFWGANSRLDAMQAAMLLVKLDKLDGWIEARRRNAAFYQEAIAGLVKVPGDHPDMDPSYQTFVVECDRRDDLQTYLASQGIDTKVHYAIPIHLQEAAAYLGYRPGDFPVAEAQAGRILSLPVYPEMPRLHQEIVVEAIQRFYSGSLTSSNGNDSCEP